MGMITAGITTTGLRIFPIRPFVLSLAALRDTATAVRFVMQAKGTVFIMLTLLFFALALPAAQPAEISMAIVDYPNTTMVERGGSVQFDIRVENKGSVDLHNVSIRIENATFLKVGFVPESVPIFSSKSAQTFHVNLTVPTWAASGSYPALLEAHSSELDDVKPVTLRVFDLKAELVLYKLQFLRDNLLELEKKIAVAESEGRNAEAPLSESLRNINAGISVSEQRLYDKRYDDALLAMADVERTMKNAGQTVDEIISARTTSWWGTWGYAVIIIAAIILASAGAIFLFIARHRAGREDAEKLKCARNSNNLAMLGVHSKRAREVRDEIGALRSTLALVESEHDEALMSHESYVELKEDLESRIAKLDVELEKIERGGVA